MKTSRALLLTLVLGASLWGCGGGGISGASRDKASGAISIVWPAPSRLLPKASNSVVVEIRDGSSNLIASKTLMRPATGGTTTANFTDLPLGTFSLTATAFPGSDGTGIRQASGSTNIATNFSIPFSTTVTMDSTIAGFTVNGLPSSTTTKVNEFETTNLTISAVDASGNIVLTRPQDLTVTGGSGLVTYSAGVLTGVTAGSTSLTISDADSGKIATAPITVNPFPDGYYTTTQSGGANVRVQALVTARIPTAAITRWQYFAPYGADISDQQLISTSSSVALASGSYTSTVKSEPGGFARKYYAGDISASLLANPRELPVAYDISVRTAKRNLAPGRPATLPTDISVAEKVAYTAETDHCNYRSATVQAWMNSHNLWKQSNETSIDFAKRVCNAMQSDFTYAIIPATTSANHITLRQGDCGGLALVVQAALRANGIPCRFITGGGVQKSGGPLDPNLPASWGTCGHHATLEMWHRTAGWVRVDGSNSVNLGAADVGLDDDSFVAFSVGEEFDVSPVNTGFDTPWLIQSPGFWVFYGSGDTSGFTVDYSWTVTRS